MLPGGLPGLQQFGLELFLKTVVIMVHEMAFHGSHLEDE